MIKPEAYSAYRLADTVVRLVSVRGTWYYCVHDLCKALKIARPRSIIRRLLSEESLKINFDSSCFRCVSVSGLLAMVPQSWDRGKERRALIGLIRFAEAQPGNPLFQEKENRKYFTVGKSSVLVIVDGDSFQTWFCRSQLSKALSWNWIDYEDDLSMREEVRQFDITILDNGKEQIVKAKFLSATGLIALTPRGGHVIGRRSEIVKLICEADRLASEVKEYWANSPG